MARLPGGKRWMAPILWARPSHAADAHQRPASAGRGFFPRPHTNRVTVRGAQARWWEPAFTWAVKARQVWPVTARAGPCGSLESRTATTLAVVATSTHSPPLLLRRLFRHPGTEATSTHAPPLLLRRLFRHVARDRSRWLAAVIARLP